jgi:hypothetical protein
MLPCVVRDKEQRMVQADHDPPKVFSVEQPLRGSGSHRRSHTSSSRAVSFGHCDADGAS